MTLFVLCPFPYSSDSVAPSVVRIQSILLRFGGVLSGVEKRRVKWNRIERKTDRRAHRNEFAICQTSESCTDPYYIIRIVNVKIMFKLSISSFRCIVMATYEQMGLDVIRIVCNALSFTSLPLEHDWRSLHRRCYTHDSIGFHIRPKYTAKIYNFPMIWSTSIRVFGMYMYIDQGETSEYKIDRKSNALYSGRRETFIIIFSRMTQFQCATY